MNFLKNKKTFLKIILGILLLSNLYLVFLLFQDQHVIIKNNSRLYTLSYQSTKKFSSILDTWKVFSKEVTVNNNLVPIKKLIIESVDTIQPITQSLDNKQNVIVSSSSSYSQKGTFLIKIYVNPTVSSQFTQKELNDYVVYHLLTKLYALTHTNLTTRTLNAELTPIYNQLKENSDSNPITVRFK